MKPIYIYIKKAHIRPYNATEEEKSPVALTGTNLSTSKTDFNQKCKGNYVKPSTETSISIGANRYEFLTNEGKKVVDIEENYTEEEKTRE